jgi:hypothetical protein
MKAIDKLKASDMQVKEEMTEEEEKINSAIFRVARKQKDAISDVSRRFRETKNEISGLVYDMESIGSMLQNKMTSDIDGVKRKYQVIHDQIDNAVAAEKYQDADVVQGVVKALTESQNQTDKLNAYKDSVIIPSILTWRQGVEAVFEKLDLAFNHSRIAQLAERSLASEGDDARILSEEEEMQMRISNAEREMMSKVAEIRKQAADAIAKINAMTHLNATMREKMIAQINAEAQAGIYALHQKHNALELELRGTSNELDSELKSLDALLNRADQLDSAKITSKKYTRALVAQLKTAMRSLRKTFNGESLLQVGRPPDPFAEVLAATRAAGAVRASEDKAWEASLSEMEQTLNITSS